MALFVPLDIDYQSDPKIIAAGFYGEGLYNRALALSKEPGHALRGRDQYGCPLQETT